MMSAAQAKKPVMIWQVMVSKKSWSNRRRLGLAVEGVTGTVLLVVTFRLETLVEDATLLNSKLSVVDILFYYTSLFLTNISNIFFK